MTWTCPECKRVFRNKNQWHSCVKLTLEDHLFNKPDTTQKLFHYLHNELQKFAKFKLGIVKTAVQFRCGANFLNVQVKKYHLELEFQMPFEADEFPVHKTIQISGNRYMHYIIVSSIEEIDTQLLSWLNEAYKLVLNSK